MIVVIGGSLKTAVVASSSFCLLTSSLPGDMPLDDPEPTPGREPGRERSPSPGLTPREEQALAQASQRRQTRRGSGASGPSAAVMAAIGLEDSQVYGCEGMEDAPPGALVVQEDHEIDDMIKEIKAELTSAEKKEIHKVVKDYSEKMRSFLRTKARIEKMKEEKVQLSKGEIPNGCKRFKMPFVCKEMDIVMDTMSDTVINFTIPKGTSYRKAKELIHIEALAIQHSIDFKVTDMQLNDKREEIDFGRFIKDCMRPSDETAAQIQELGLDIPKELFPASTKLTRDMAIGLYRKVVRKLADEQKRMKDSKEKDSAERKKIVDEAAKLNPKEKYEASIVQVVDKYLRDKDYKTKAKAASTKDYVVDYVGLQTESSQNPQPVEAHVTKREHTKKELNQFKKQKNKNKESGEGQSPGEASGYNGKGKGGKSKGKGKGKGKDNQTKGKGKGKSNWENPGKGNWENPSKGKYKGKSEDKGKGKGKTEQKGGKNNAKNGKGASKGKKKEGKGKWN